MSAKSNSGVVGSAVFVQGKNRIMFDCDIRKTAIQTAVKGMGLRFAPNLTAENEGHSVYYSLAPITLETISKALPMVKVECDGKAFVPAKKPVTQTVSGRSSRVVKSKVETVKSVNGEPTSTQKELELQNSRTNLDRLGREIKPDLPFCTIAELRTMWTAENGGKHRRNVLANLRDELAKRKAELVDVSTATTKAAELAKPIVNSTPTNGVKDMLKYTEPVDETPTTTKPTNSTVLAKMATAMHAMAEVLEALANA